MLDFWIEITVKIVFYSLSSFYLVWWHPPSLFHSTKETKPFLPLTDSFSFTFYLQITTSSRISNLHSNYFLMVSQKLDDDSPVLLWLRMWCCSWSFQHNLMAALFSPTLKQFSSLLFLFEWKRASFYRCKAVVSDFGKVAVWYKCPDLTWWIAAAEDMTSWCPLHPLRHLPLFPLPDAGICLTRWPAQMGKLILFGGEKKSE